MVERKLTGAHYGLRDWTMQHATAAIMLIYTTTLLVILFIPPKEHSAWQAFFDQAWVEVFAQVSSIAVLLHAWVGVRNLWMDYIKPFGVCLPLQVATIVWLANCLVYSVKVIQG